MMLNNKRGISSVIATLLLVLLTIVLIGIVWLVINNIVSSTNQQISIGGLTLNLKIQQASIGQNNISVVVQRQSGAGNLSGIRFVVFDGLNSGIVDENANLDVYEGKDFIISPSNVNINSAETVSVAPIYLNNAGVKQIGSITDTYTFGPASQNISIGTINTCTPAIDPSFAGLCTNNGYTCGNVNNGTCSTVSCGSCGSNQYCNILTHQCAASNTGGGNTCTPATNPTFSALCTNNGYVCGDVNNGTCGTVNCGSCGSGQVCNLLTYQCENSVSTCTPTTCSISNYQCGAAPDGCGGTLNCGTCSGNSFCNIYFQCIYNQDVNNGTIFSVWPSGASMFFDSYDLPTDPTVLATYNDGLHYVRFPNSNESSCIQLALITYLQQNGRSYVQLGSVANITTGNDYQIWNNQQGCQYAATH